MLDGSISHALSSHETTNSVPDIGARIFRVTPGGSLTTLSVRCCVAHGRGSVPPVMIASTSAPPSLRDGVDAAGRAPRVVARGARPGVVGDAALEHVDLLVAEMTMARDRRARRVAHQHGFAIGLLPQHLPEHAGPPLFPRASGDVDVEAAAACVTADRPRRMPSATRTAYTGHREIGIHAAETGGEHRNRSRATGTPQRRPPASLRSAARPRAGRWRRWRGSARRPR